MCVQGVGAALVLSSLAGACTGIGGLLAVYSAQADRTSVMLRMAKWEAATAGAMLAICLLELVPEAAETGVTLPIGVSSFVVGAVLFWLLKSLLPDVGDGVLALPVRGGKEHEETAVALKRGLVTSAAIFLHNVPEGLAVYAAALKGELRIWGLATSSILMCLVEDDGNRLISLPAAQAAVPVVCSLVDKPRSRS